MGTELKQGKTLSEAKAAYQTAVQLYQDHKWHLPTYDWNFDHVQRLHSMSAQTITAHLQQLIAAKLAIEELNQDFTAQIPSYAKTLKASTQQVNTSFKTFKYTSQHPNKVAYLKEHQVDELPQETVIDNSDTSFAMHGFIATLAIWIGWSVAFGAPAFIVTALIRNYLLPIVLVGFAVLWVTAKLHLPFSQPIELHKNHQIRALNQQITADDRKYCEVNQRNSEDLLKREFKYDETLGAVRAVYVSQVDAKVTVTQATLADYWAIINEHIGYFPPDDALDSQRLFDIYTAFMNGRATTWKEATVYADAQRQRKQIIDNQYVIMRLIENVGAAIVSAIGEAKTAIVGKVQESINATERVGAAVEQQTREIRYWETQQTNLMAVQASVMADLNRKVYHTRRR